MSEWWQVLSMAFAGGFLGGVVAYYLEKSTHRRARLWGTHPEQDKRDEDKITKPREP